MSPDSTTYLRVFQLNALSITVALRVLESPDSLRDYVATMSLTPATTDSVFRIVTQQRGVAIDSQMTTPIDVEVTPGVMRTGTFVRAWSPRGPLAQAMIVIPGQQAALVVMVSGYSHADDAEDLFRALVAASVARMNDPRARQSYDAWWLMAASEAGEPTRARRCDGSIVSWVSRVSHSRLNPPPWYRPLSQRSLRE